MAFVQCPKCSGKGGLGTFGPCARGDIHFKSACFVCGGQGQTNRTQACQKCAGKGGEGAFGPCEKNDIHFKRDCPMCQGQAYTSPVQDVAVMGWGGVQVVQQAVAQLPVCPKCNGKGGMGAFGPCERSDVHFRAPCFVCNGNCRTDRTVACPTCGGKGGSGAFGPCEKSDVHFRADCPGCKGQGYTAPPPPVMQAQPVMGGGWGGGMPQQGGWGQPQPQPGFGGGFGGPQPGYGGQQMGMGMGMPGMQMAMPGMQVNMPGMQFQVGMAPVMPAVGQIINARYHNVDVTAQVQQEAMVNGNVVRFNRDFNAMFGDPAFGTPKQLVIQYVTASGQMSTQSFAEGQWNQVGINLNV